MCGETGWYHESCCKASQYLKAIRELPIRSLINVPDDVLNAQFNDLVCRIESLVPTNTNVQNIDSKDIIKSLIKESTECYKGIEMLVQAICCASVKVSVESVIESLISVYEFHIDKLRTVKEDTSEAEIKTAINGPTIAHCDRIVKQAMDQYWMVKTKKNTWHFVRTTNIRDHSQYNVSKVVDKVSNETSKFPFMDA